MLSPIGLSHARLPWKIWVKRVMKKNKDAEELEEDLTAKSVRSPSASGNVSFGSFDRQLARAMALCTKHFRLDRALRVYNPKTGRVGVKKAFKLLRRFFISEPKAVLRKMQSRGLILFGEHEILFNPGKVGRRAQSLMPDIEVDIIAESGHACIYDQPEVSNDRIMAFLRDE